MKMKMLGSLLLLGLLMASSCQALVTFRSLVRQPTFFLGSAVIDRRRCSDDATASCALFMRKQKASDRRTRRRQRGEIALEESAVPVMATTVTANPMQGAVWKHKTTSATALPQVSASPGGGRGRSRKRTTLYQTLQHYHGSFLHPLTAEYQAEEEEVLGRIQASLEDPLGLEQAGYAVYDMYAERRGNLLGQEVYRLVKAVDATTTYPRDDDESDTIARYLPPNHKFGNNDVIVVTEQPHGSGDFFTTNTLPISEMAITAEAVVLNMGPTYIDISMAAGCFEAAFGLPGNDITGQGNKNLRLRADRFVSNIPYQRMVAALSQLTAIPEHKKAASNAPDAKDKKSMTTTAISMDDVLKEAILRMHVYTDPVSPLFGDSDVCNIEELSQKLAKPPMVNSAKLASKVLKHMQSTPTQFRDFNAPQRAAIEAALTRRMTLIQGPPGTGKTCVASAIGFGFVYQCKIISEHAKVLACAFSNVGADNLAEAMIQLGLKVVRVGKPSAVAESLWSYTLDAAIEQDASAQKALQNAARATAQLAKVNRRQSRDSASKSSSLSDRTIRDAATAAVKASIQASNVAATKALREADVIVSTSIGAADPRLLAACGVVTGMDESSASSISGRQAIHRPPDAGGRENAPDGLPPLSLPFVIVDEACQSIEPATLIPIVATNSCRSLVLLGDPCQLPPTVKSREAEALSMSLMERLAATLPHPNVILPLDSTVKDATYLDALPIKQAVSLVRSRSSDGQQRSYRKVFSGSILLTIQYRMHPSIAALPSAIFYDGLLATPNFMAERRKFPRALNKLMPCGNPDLCVRLVDVGGRGNERQGTPSKYTRTLFSSAAASASSLLEQQTTYWNEAEAERVISLLKDLLSEGPDPFVNSIGVISPYNGQVQLIKLMIASDAQLRDLLRKTPVSIEVKSVDGYQGRERDVIIFSAVRSNRQDRIGFLHDWRRMNVALTRAKSALVVVGDLDTLSSADKNWHALTSWASSMRCIVNDYECTEDEASL